MKLSEAIRLGSVLIKPVRRKYLSTDGTSGCVLGMAMRAITERDIPVNRLHEFFPLLEVLARHPLYPELTDHVVNIVMGLFDTERWTVEQIAAWVEGLEKVTPLPVEPTHTVGVYAEVEA